MITQHSANYSSQPLQYGVGTQRQTYLNLSNGVDISKGISSPRKVESTESVSSKQRRLEGIQLQINSLTLEAEKVRMLVGVKCV